MHAPHLLSGGRYPVLRSLAILYLLGGVLAAIGGLIGVIWALAAGPGSMMDRLIISAGILVAAFFATITALAVAELLKLFIDVEHNTRAATMASATTPSIAPHDGAGMGGRLAQIDEETAEAALVRGH